MLTMSPDLRGNPRSARKKPAIANAHVDPRPSPSLLPPGPHPYDLQALQAEFAGIRGDPFAATATAADSPLGFDLYALKHSDELPFFTARQYLTAILLSFEDRSATKDQILEVMASWPAVQKWVKDHGINKLLNMSAQDLIDRGLCVPGVNALRSVAALLSREERRYATDFPLKQALEKYRDNREELRREEQDPPGEPRPYRIDYGCDDWIEQFDEEFYADTEQLGGCNFMERNYTLRKLKENCVFDDYIPGWVAEESR